MNNSTLSHSNPQNIKKFVEFRQTELKKKKEEKKEIRL